VAKTALAAEAVPVESGSRTLKPVASTTPALLSEGRHLGNCKDAGETGRDVMQTPAYITCRADGLMTLW
jgi:hypothetical protein